MTSSQRLEKHGPIIIWFARGAPSVCKAIIQEADSDLINTFCECGYNIIDGNVTLSPTQKQELRPHTEKFGVILDKKTSIAKKRKSLQSGGFAVALAKAALPVVLSTLGDLFKHKRARPGAFGRSRYGF